MVSVHSFVDSWKTVRKDSVQALLDMPAGSLDFQPVPELMPFQDIAVHILNAGHALAGLLLDGVDDMTTPDFRPRMAGYFLQSAAGLPREELADLMLRSLDEDCARIEAQPAEFWAAAVKKFDGTPLTRMEMLQFTKEHELTHRSQMFVYLRLKGVVPPTTRRKLAKK